MKTCLHKEGSFQRPHKKIKFLCLERLKQLEKFNPSAFNRFVDGYSFLKHLIKNIVGLIFIFSRFPSGNVLFQGVRNLEYMKCFDPKLVVIMGDKTDKKIAADNGYGFIWDFSVYSAVAISVFSGIDFFLYFQSLIWKIRLASNKKYLFFLYEDTQFCGTFLSVIGNVCPSTVKVVCIQHGMGIEQSKIRSEGAITRYNLLLDIGQVNVIGCDVNYSREIGYPYLAEAKKARTLRVFYIGAGWADIPEFFEKTLEFYKNIDSVLSEKFGVYGKYRPHPAELCDVAAMRTVNKYFSELDRTSKIDLLNSEKSIFIGHLSTLLHEAKLAGHSVVVFDLGKASFFNQFLDLEGVSLEPRFEYDLKIDISKHSEIVTFFTSFVELMDSVVVGARTNPNNRFVSALVDLDLVNPKNVDGTVVRLV